MIYLDHNATTPVDPAVIETVCECLAGQYGNPSSPHSLGRAARAVVEKARATVAAALQCEPDEVYFTSGGTESNNLAIIGTAMARGEGHIVTSAIEHPSVINPLRYLETRGYRVTYAGVDRQGRVSLDEVREAISGDTFLITVMHSNNETGVLQPVEELSSLARSRGIVLHTDAAQSVGKTPVTSANVDMMTIVPHKFYGPKGTGALFIRKSAEPQPVLFGAGHERGLRPGTENVPGIAGLGKACELAAARLPETVPHLLALKKALLEGLKEAIGGLRVNGHTELALPNTLNVCIPGVDGAELSSLLGDRLAMSAGSACHAGLRSPSPVLTAMGLGYADAMSSIRLSLGRDNTMDEVKEAVRILSDACRRQARAG
jgi:cysteine desulfurase